MKWLTTTLLCGSAIALYGCGQNTPGGPGTALPDSEKALVGQTDNTFALDVPALPTRVAQGETDTFTVAIKRGANFAQDVEVDFVNVPSGVHLEPDTPKILRSEDSVDISVHASPDAALGDFSVKVLGHPETGADAMAELTLTVAAPDDAPPPATTANEAVVLETEAARIEVSAEKIEDDAARLDRDSYIKQMQDELDALKVKYEELKVRAAEATDDAKVELDKRIAAAQVKLEEAEQSLKEAKDAAPERWEKIKKGFKGAADELKSMFE